MARYRYKRTHSLKNKRFILYIILLLLVMGIGYAALTSNLSISGNTEIASNTWNIHFENASDSSTGTAEIINHATISGTNNSIVTYGVKLKNNTDTYEFTVDVVNAGSLPGKVSLSSMSGLSTEASTYIDYTVTYLNGTPVSIGDILNAGATKKIKVKVFYKEGVSVPSDLNLSLYYNLQYVQSEEDEFDTNALVQQLKTENSSCFTKYEGQVTDQVGVTKQAENVYFNRCADKRNIIFNNMCWQMIRTTETGGVKMIYNGEPVNGKCESTRGGHKGIVGNTRVTTSELNGEYLYGDSFTYDTTNNTFTLTDTTTATWSDSIYESLLGKFTCKNTEGTCTTLYNVNGYYNATTAYTSSYTIRDTYYPQIGISAFNANHRSPAMVGYMFNKVYNFKGGAPTSGSLMGNDVSYANGSYTLLPADGESELGTTLDNTHHYTCNTTSSTCNKVRFYYYNNYYIELDGEANIEEAVNNMLYNDNVNRYNSSIKGIIDAWYKQNLLSKTNMLEDTVYCNARNMINQSTNGWNKDGSLTTLMHFKYYNNSNDLSCINVTDQFAVSNNKAKLTYPVALLEEEERYNISNPSLMGNDDYWWELSPFNFDETVAVVSYVVRGAGSYDGAGNFNGVRLVVSLSAGAVISSGTGSEESPFVIQE